MKVLAIFDINKEKLLEQKKDEDWDSEDINGFNYLSAFNGECGWMNESGIWLEQSLPIPEIIDITIIVNDNVIKIPKKNSSELEQNQDEK